MDLHQRAYELLRPITTDPDRYGVAIRRSACGVTVVDCGVAAAGGFETGRILAEVCLGGLGQVSFHPATTDGTAPSDGGEACGPVGLATVQVVTDAPVAACLGSQYAGWKVSRGRYFAMASGPMRAAGSRETLLADLGLRVPADGTVGVLEASALPPDEVCAALAADCGLPAETLVLLVARTGSPAGLVQVVARSVEVALHKLVTLGFDVRQVRSGFGTAPLPPPTTDDGVALGRTNDAILYGGSVTLTVDGTADLADLAAAIPSVASPQFGRPFGEVFAAAGHDFFKIDTHLFSPAEIVLVGLKTGARVRCGGLRPDILAESFGHVETVAPQRA